MTWTGVIFLGRGMLPMLWGICALTLFGPAPSARRLTCADGHGHAVAPIEAMPAMIAQLLGPASRVSSSRACSSNHVRQQLLPAGLELVLSQDVILPIRKKLGKGDMSSKSQILINRLANVGVSLFVMFWGLYYPLSGATTCT